MWEGDAFAEFGGEWWARGEVARLEELRLHARETRAETLLGMGRVEAAVSEARALTAEAPSRERAWRVLVIGSYRGGRQGEALRCAAEYRAWLREELGLDPANRNGAGQVVAAGPRDALARLAETPPTRARVAPLAVAGAFTLKSVLLKDELAGED